MTKNSCDRSLLSQVSICQIAPGRLSADTPVSSRNDELQEDGRALWLAPGEASRVNPPAPQQSRHGGGACGRWSHSGHCRRHRPWHDNSSSSSMRSEPTAEPAAEANGDVSGEWVNVSQRWWGVFFPLSTQISGWDSPIPSGALSHCQTHSAQAGTQVRTQPAHRAFTPATVTHKRESFPSNACWMSYSC